MERDIKQIECKGPEVPIQPSSICKKLLNKYREKQYCKHGPHLLHVTFCYCLGFAGGTLDYHSQTLLGGW
jgi:hypothetical protein